MYILKTEASFDSAHFLFGYDGKCSNIHGHRWRLCVEIYSESLEDGMIVDFGVLKSDLKNVAEAFDHTLIYERGSLKNSTLTALSDENFSLTEVDFRPTAENFAKYFFDIMADKGYRVKSMTVYETPNNCAVYTA